MKAWRGLITDSCEREQGQINLIYLLITSYLSVLPIAERVVDLRTSEVH